MTAAIADRRIQLRKALIEALNQQSTSSDHSWLTREEVIDAVIPVVEENTVVVVHNVQCSHEVTL
jgi:benzoyl-CoA reductase/2-hydroxyglutaryl-CoA dehydratase subunit BcrC/BadD/HgdB